MTDIWLISWVLMVPENIALGVLIAFFIVGLAVLLSGAIATRAAEAYANDGGARVLIGTAITALAGIILLAIFLAHIRLY